MGGLVAKASTMGVFGSSDKKRSKKQREEDKEEKAREKAHGKGEAYTGKASAKAEAAHSKAFGTSIPTIFGALRAGFGETGGNYSGVSARPGDPRLKQRSVALSSSGGLPAISTSGISGTPTVKRPLKSVESILR